MKKLITILLLLLPMMAMSQVKVYNDEFNLVTVEFSPSNIKKASANAALSFYNVGNYIWFNKSINGETEELFRNQRFDSIKNEAGDQLAATLQLTLDSLAVIVSNSPQAGEANTASNLGEGVGVYEQKVGNDLQFNSLVSTDSTISFETLSGEINATLTYNQTGWAQYDDTQYTNLSPFTVTSGSKVTLPNNAGSVIESQMPTDISEMYDESNQIITGRNGDGLALIVEFKASPLMNVTGGRVRVTIDIGGSVGEIYPFEFLLTRGVGVEHYVLYSVASAYTLDTWEANGGTVKVECIGTGANIYDIRYVLTRTHKAR